MYMMHAVLTGVLWLQGIKPYQNGVVWHLAEMPCSAQQQQ
jgi:hypothetical protein